MVDSNSRGRARNCRHSRSAAELGGFMARQLWAIGGGGGTWAHPVSQSAVKLLAIAIKEAAMPSFAEPDAVVFWVTTVLCLLCALAG